MVSVWQTLSYGYVSSGRSLCVYNNKIGITQFLGKPAHCCCYCCVNIWCRKKKDETKTLVAFGGCRRRTLQPVPFGVLIACAGFVLERAFRRSFVFFLWDSYDRTIYSLNSTTLPYHDDALLLPGHSAHLWCTCVLVTVRLYLLLIVSIYWGILLWRSRGERREREQITTATAIVIILRVVKMLPL